jgi:hypothetical protein
MTALHFHAAPALPDRGDQGLWGHASRALPPVGGELGGVTGRLRTPRGSAPCGRSTDRPPHGAATMWIEKRGRRHRVYFRSPCRCLEQP